MHISKAALTLMALALLQMACSKSPNSSTTSGNNQQDGSLPTTAYQTQQYAVTQVENAAGQSEGTTAAVAAKQHVHKLTSRLGVARTTCPTTLVLPACSNGVSNFNFNSCTEADSSGDSFTLTGTFSLNVTNAATGAADNSACTGLTQSQAALPIGDSAAVSLNFTAVVNSFQAAPKFNGMQVSENTQPTTAWDGTALPNGGQGIVVSTTSANRVLTINGVQDEVIAPHGSVWINNITQGQLTVTGTLTAGNRTIVNGSTLISWDNLNKFKVIHAAGNDPSGNPVTWGNPQCCHPTSGQFTSTYSGSMKGTSTLTFANTPCGAAVFVDTNNQSTTLTLPSCGITPGT